jgi:uncharacterized protein YjdB
MKRTLLSAIAFTITSFGANAQNVNIPDANFKAYLVGNSSINTNMDTEIQMSEASVFNGTINCNNMNISELTGIEAFTSLNALLCSNNSISSLDISANTTLTVLNCSNNPSLSNIVLSQPNLEDLAVFNCNLSTLDVSLNPSLISLSCSGNNLTSLDVSNNSNLETLSCQDNNLSALNLKNISTANILYFDALNNPNLTCIEVDDVLAATNTWTNIDAGASFSLDCSIYVTSITLQGQAGESTITTQGGTLQMEATVLPANADDGSYTWSVTNGTGSASIDGGGLLTATTNGTVTVTATANDGSGVTGSAIITISNQNSLGISDSELVNNISIYPNPATSEINISSDNFIESIEFIDVFGKVIKSILNSNNTIDVSNLSNGLYFLQVYTKEGSAIKKFIKD